MSVQSTRATVVAALVISFTVVHLAWPFLTASLLASGLLPAAPSQLLALAAEALIAWVITSCLSLLWRRRQPTVKR